MVDEAALKANFRKMLFKHNKEKLNNTPFIYKEFNRILIHLEGKSIYNSSKLFRDKFVLERGDGTEVYLEFKDGNLIWFNEINVNSTFLDLYLS